VHRSPFQRLVCQFRDGIPVSELAEFMHLPKNRPGRSSRSCAKMRALRVQPSCSLDSRCKNTSVIADDHQGHEVPSAICSCFQR
jgi:hypothetical protein